ncbi:Major facilitator superfamily domain containing protein [Amanita muscaria]
MSLRERIKGVSLIFACGTALFSDGYANGVIGVVNTILGRVYGPDALTNHQYKQVINSMGFAGMVIGMLIFGYLSDKIGRKWGMMTAISIIAFFSALSAASEGANGDVAGTLGMLTAMRFLLGIGLGAEYPSGSVAASEQSEESSISKNAQHRWFALATNSMIDLGFVFSSFVPLVLYWIFGPDHLRAVWRLSLGLGAVPALLVLLWRLNMEEPVRFRKDSMKRTPIPYFLVFKKYGLSMSALAIAWFIYDFITYPFGLYSSVVVNNITGGADSLTVVLGWATVINLFYMPGTIFGAFIIDYLGPKNTMIFGLLCQAVIGFIMSGLYNQLSTNIGAFAVVYGIFLSFGEVGPGNCLGLLASKTGPTAVRGQYYGLVAAIGKIGAFIGTWAFPPMIKAFGGDTTARGNTGPFWVGSGLAILSALIVFFFLKPIGHDGMEEEDRQFREYLEMHGYDTSQMGLGDGLSDVASSEKIDVKTDEKIDA